MSGEQSFGFWHSLYGSSNIESSRSNKIGNAKGLLTTLKSHEKEPHMESFITEDHTYLNLSYLRLDEGCSYNQYFDQLDKEIQTYTKVKKLRIETDFIYSLPDNVSKF